MTAQKKKRTTIDIQETETDSGRDQLNGRIENGNEEDTEKTVSDRPDETSINSGDSIQTLKEKLAAKESEAKEYYDRYLRLAAEFDNFKKRSARERDEFRKFANESLIQELLTVADNLERAILSIKDDETASPNVLKGIDMTYKEILKVFEKFQVKPIDALGEQFDPTFHQAVMQEETDLRPDNTVLSELQKGYLIHDRLLRPSMVVVSKSATKENET